MTQTADPTADYTAQLAVDASTRSSSSRCPSTTR
jgi:hypothetical protein